MDIQAAIAAACDPSSGSYGGVVHVPAGIYLLDAGLIFPGNDNPNLNAQDANGYGWTAECGNYTCTSHSFVVAVDGLLRHLVARVLV